MASARGTHISQARPANPSDSPIRGLALRLALIAAVIGATGCSTRMSRRDEFYLIRGLTFQPAPGDGSTIVVGREQDVLRAIAGADEAPIRGVDLDR